jgi:hypothetical protein
MENKMKQCIQCKKDISDKRCKTKYCSLSCSTKHNRLKILQYNLPDNHKRCGKCNSVKNFSEFRKNKNSAFGYSYFCKECDKSRVYSTDKRRILLNAAKKRAKDNCIDFDIDINDIILPEKCPVLGIELKFNSNKADFNSYSIDRIDNSKGYVKGNIQIISFKANTIKSSATLEEIEQVYNYMKNMNREH